MTELLLGLILIILILQWLNWKPEALTDYLRWKWRELYRWNNARRARKRKRHDVY